MPTLTPTFVAVIVEFSIAILNGLALLLYYQFKPRSEIANFQCIFGIFLIINTCVTLVVNLQPVTECYLWYFQGISFNTAETVVDWIFLIRVYKLEQKWWMKAIWQVLFWGLDVIPRVVSIAMYSTSVSNTGLCLLSLPSTARLTKSVMNTVFVGIVGIYFVYMMVSSIGRTSFNDTRQKLESLTITSSMFGILLCVIRTVTYIPYILNTFGPVWTGVLIPIEMSLLPPILFLSIVYGSKMKTGSGMLSGAINSFSTSSNGPKKNGLSIL
ncbi:hypothetical protein HDV01_007735 [Terramyces sp. JEL0728]|nr:hypothetical protein HDV01_007735 [Terramyces sp. JEL0728]